MASLQHCPVSMTTGETGWGGEGPPPQGDERSGAAPAAATSVGDYAPGLEFAESLAGSAASAGTERTRDVMLGLEAPPCHTTAPAARRAAPPRRTPAAATATSTASPAPATVAATATATAASGRGARNASWRPGKTTAMAVASTGAGGPPSEAAPEGAAVEPGGGRSAGGAGDGGTGGADGAEGDVLVLKPSPWNLFPCHFYFEPRKRRLASLNAEALVSALLERDLPNLAAASSSSAKPPAKRSRRQCSLDSAGATGGCGRGGRGGMAPKRRGAGGGGGGNDARGNRTAKNAGAASQRKRPRRASGVSGRELVRSRSDPGPLVVAPAKPCRPAGRGGRATRANPGSAGAGRAGASHAGERQSPVRFPRLSASAAPSYAPCEPCCEWGCGCGCRVGEEAGAGAGPVGKAAVGSAVDPRAARVCLVKLPHAESIIYGTRANGSSDGRRTNHQHHHRHRRHQQHHRHHHHQHHHHQHKHQHSHLEDTEDNEEEHSGYGCRAAQARHPSARPASGLPRPLALYPARSIPASPYPELPSPGCRNHPGTGLLFVPAGGGSRAGAGRGADKRGSQGAMRGARGAAAAAASAASLVCEVALSYTARRQTNGWVPVGEAYEKAVYVAGELELVPRRCYGAVRRGGDIIAVRDCVLLRSGPRRKCLPYVAKISALWDDPKTGELTMSLLWYYRPEHTQGGRVPGQHCENEVFASRHQDENSVACIEDKCYVLTYLEYCRFQAEVRQREESGRRASPLARPSAGVVPALPARVAPPHRCLPDRANPSLVYLCRRVYDFRLGRILKNPI